MENTFKSNYGNFDYTLTVELAEDSLSKETLALVTEGLANIGYRFAGSAFDKHLEVEPKSKGGEGGRGVEFKPETGETITTFVQDLIDKDKDLQGLGLT